jgi:hypothetical protein
MHIDGEAHDTADSVALSGTDTFGLGAGEIVQLAALAAAGIDSTPHAITAVRMRPRIPRPCQYSRRSASLSGAS